MIELTETLDKAPIQGCRRITAVDSRIDRVHTMGLRSARCESTRDPDTTEGFRHGGKDADLPHLLAAIPSPTTTVFNNRMDLLTANPYPVLKRLRLDTECVLFFEQLGYVSWIGL